MPKDKNTNGQNIVYLKISDKLLHKLKSEGAEYGMTGGQYARYLCIKHFERRELYAHDA